MRITDEQIATFKKQGFVIIENFLTEAEREAVLDGFYKWFAPPYAEYVASGRKNSTVQQKFFPWDHSGLNHAMTHPDLIDAAERIVGTRDIRLSEAHLGMKYAGEPSDVFYHIDYSNSTLGPIQDPDEFKHPVFFYCFDDVLPGMAPIMMVPNGKPESEAVPMIVPGGSVCIYSIFTNHSASPFTTAEGHRPVAWVAFTRNDRLWDGSRSFSYGIGEACVKDYMAYNKGIERFIVEATPRQLEMLGFQPPGHPQWTEKFIQAMADRYAGFNTVPYKEQLR